MPERPKADELSRNRVNVRTADSGKGPVHEVASVAVDPTSLGPAASMDIVLPSRDADAVPATLPSVDQVVGTAMPSPSAIAPEAPQPAKRRKRRRGDEIDDLFGDLS